MKIVSFSVKNYRSITEASKIELGNYNVLIGKNNEGKSNILKALLVCMDIIENQRHSGRLYFSRLKRDSRYISRSVLYDWARDFPISFQNRVRGQKTIFKLEFLLTNDEIIELNRITRTNISNNNLVLQIEIDKNNVLEIKIPRKGTKSLTNNYNKVLAFLSSKITYNYISARRQEDDTIEMIERSISNEFASMEDNPKYKGAIDTIRSLQMSRLDKISKEIKPMLSEFIPNINSIKIEYDTLNSFNRALNRDMSIMIDDGTLTNIEFKGDGIKSLMALAIIKNRTVDNRTSIIAIDEPEAHLHPGAMYELSKTIKDLSKDNQVIISTHSQHFMNNEDVRNNIIVNAGKAKSAKNIHEIREILGIRMSDNLMNAEHILLVEGESDKVIISKIFSKKSDKLRKALNDRKLAIYSCGGAPQIATYLNIFNNQLCKCYVLVDNDVSGKDVRSKIIEEKIIGQKEVYVLICNGMKESEIEDCLLPDTYAQFLDEELRINVDNSRFRNNKKWSERIKNIASSVGIPWDDKLEKNIKEIVAEAFSKSDKNELLIEEKSSVLNKLISDLEEKI